MAARTRRKQKVIRFNLTPRGLVGLAVVCFCVFLWMFLLGMWAGQTVLQPAIGDGAAHEESDREVETYSANRGGVPGPGIQPAAVDKVADPNPGAGLCSVFSLQVEAVGDEQRARETLLDWQARGHNAFLLKPSADTEPFWRVFVGRYESLAEANSQALVLEKEEKVKVYITLVPAVAVPLS